MKRVYPDYYPQFRCIADQCRHNCCIGWEIDIDYATMNKYRRMKGEMGDRVRSCIKEEGITGSFILTEDDRCPLLNENGLCDLISVQGEKALCQICADHPRFRNRLTDREETGLGLCCEAACRLILDHPDPVRLILMDNGRAKKAALNKLEKKDVEFRDDMLRIAQDRSLPVEQRMDRLLAAAHVRWIERPFSQWVALLQSLERLDEAWTRRLTDTNGEQGSVILPETQLEQLLVYFLYRYLTDQCEWYPMTKVLFAVLSVRLIRWLCRTPEDVYEVARQYSAEVEYSAENMNDLMEYLENNLEEVWES